MKTTLKNIPKTGRIGRFAKIIKKELGEKVLLMVMQDSNKYKSLKAPEQAEWWKSAIEHLKKEVGKDKAIEIMHCCGQKCCGKGVRALAKRLMKGSNSVEEFLEKSSSFGKKGDIEYKLKDKNTIIGTLNKCFCGQVRQVKTPFKDVTSSVP